MTATTIYRTTVKGGIDQAIAEIPRTDPVAALEHWAARCDMSDYSIDTDGLRVILCPANSTFRYYAYRQVVVDAFTTQTAESVPPADKLRALCDDAAEAAKAALARGDKASEEFHSGRQCAFLAALNIVRA